MFIDADKLFLYHTDMLDIVKIGDDVLREKSTPFKKFGSEIALLADAMIETLHEEQGLGLAAPQLGINQRLFVVELPGEMPLTFVNPEILETSHELVPYEEGCLSIPGVYAEVMRPASIKIQAQDPYGKAFTLQAEGLLARVVQHELDHLNGILFVDKLAPEKREQVLKVYEKKNKLHKRKKTRV